jgi:uncharacterized RDD family membrane protein YckC
MRTIDIRTTQNVVITYDIAALSDRILALVIDWIILGVSWALLMYITVRITMGSDAFLVMTYIYFMMFSCYTLFCEVVFNGQTIGKMVLRTRVVSLEGKHLSFYDYTLRWAFRIVDIYLTFGALGALLSSSTNYGQRIGGLVSNSTVVKVNSKLRVQLKDLLKINTLGDHQPQYIGVRNFKESDMLLVKQTLDRYRKYKNQAHREAVKELAETMREKLGIEEAPKSTIDFLKTLLRDYIVLTR